MHLATCCIGGSGGQRLRRRRRNRVAPMPRPATPIPPTPSPSPTPPPSPKTSQSPVTPNQATPLSPPDSPVPGTSGESSGQSSCVDLVYLEGAELDSAIERIVDDLMFSSGPAYFDDTWSLDSLEDSAEPVQSRSFIKMLVCEQVVYL